MKVISAEQKRKELDAEKSQQLIATYESAIISLKDAGAMRSVVNLENEIKTEKRRMRAFSREDPEVLLALAQRRDHEEAQERQRQQTIAVANARTLTAAKLRQEIKDNQEILKKRKREILGAECLLEMKHAMKTYSLVDLGDGRSCGGKASGTTARGSRPTVPQLRWIIASAKKTISLGGRTRGTKRC